MVPTLLQAEISRIQIGQIANIYPASMRKSISFLSRAPMESARFLLLIKASAFYSHVEYQVL